MNDKSIGVAARALAAMLYVQALTAVAALTVPVLAPSAAAEIGLDANYVGIYAAVLYFAWAALGCHRDGIAAGGVFLITVGLALRMVLEEQLLRRAYPEYDAYAQRTKRVVPFLL